MNTFGVCSALELELELELELKLELELELELEHEVLETRLLLDSYCPEEPLSDSIIDALHVILTSFSLRF